LAEALGKAGIKTVMTREPGGSPGAEEIRNLLLDGGTARWDAETMALLMVAARRDHLVKVIRPALASGHWVVCDRFMDSTEAYQGFGGGVPRDRIRELHRLIAGDFAPDLTLILDLPVELGLKRAQAHRFKQMGTEFHERMRSGFLDIAQREQKRCVVIDAREDLAAVALAVKAAVRERLGIKL
jgi:dTMP kinase